MSNRTDNSYYVFHTAFCQSQLPFEQRYYQRMDELGKIAMLCFDIPYNKFVAGEWEEVQQIYIRGSIGN